MGLFRPYDSRKDETAAGGATAAPRPRGSSRDQVDEPSAPPRAQGKGTRTPTRREAEAARRERLNPVLSPQEEKRRERQARSERRAAALSATEGSPERVLLRDYIDSRWTVAEFLLPAMILVLAASFLSSRYPQIIIATTVAAYVLFFVTAVDLFVLWRGFGKVLAERLPRASSRGLLMVAVNRAMSIRRFRVPAPRIRRGEPY